MSTEQDREFARLDAQLARLPQWQPPPDFAARLAAAAARQAAEPVATSPTSAWLWWRFVHHLPVALLAGAVALVLATLPWPALNPALPWILAAGSATFGLVLTLRLLRAP